MSLDATWLFVSLIPGAIGFVLVVYGKKQQRCRFSPDGNGDATVRLAI